MSSFTSEVDARYSTTRLSLAEERSYAKERTCKHAGYFCDAALCDTVRCHGCARFYCQAHMVDVLCAGCDALDLAADEFNRRAAA